MTQTHNVVVSVILALSASLAACRSSTAAEPVVQSISVSVGVSGSRILALNRGEPVALTVVARDVNGQTVQPRSDFLYVSRSTTVATVSTTGVVNGHIAGSTYVVVSLLANGRTLSDSIQVTVTVGR